MFCVVAQALSGCICMAKLNAGREHSSAIDCWDLSLALLNRLSHAQHSFASQTISEHSWGKPSTDSLGAAILFWRAGEFKDGDMVGFSPESSPGH